MPYSVWPSASTRAAPVTTSIVEQPPSGSLALAGQAPVVVVASTGSFDFTTMSTQDPLSVGGTWTNNTQATGSNTVYGKQSSMRVIAAFSGGINIAAGDATGQDSPPAAQDYMDSFAFLPGFSGNQRITATIYKASGYVPADRHEIELILGCATTSGSGGNGTHKWIECGWATAGDRFMAVLGGGFPGSQYPGAPNDFLVESPTDSGFAFGTALADGDVWRADFNRSTFTVTTYLNDTLILTMVDSTNFAGLGDGIGIAMFRRTSNGDSAANKFGFRNVTITSF